VPLSVANDPVANEAARGKTVPREAARG